MRWRAAWLGRLAGVTARVESRPRGLGGAASTVGALHQVRRKRFADRRVYLTGHSMGGHGAWHLGANDPDLWLAIAPCAGWASFDSYGASARDGVHAALWRGADLAGDTMALIANLAQLPVFILHGEEDRTVPADEAAMTDSA